MGICSGNQDRSQVRVDYVRFGPSGHIQYPTIQLRSDRSIESQRECIENSSQERPRYAPTTHPFCKPPQTPRRITQATRPPEAKHSKATTPALPFCPAPQLKLLQSYIQTISIQSQQKSIEMDSLTAFCAQGRPSPKLRLQIAQPPPEIQERFPMQSVRELQGWPRPTLPAPAPNWRATMVLPSGWVVGRAQDVVVAARRRVRALRGNCILMWCWFGSLVSLLSD